MRELAYAGLVAILFGLGSFYATDQFGGFNAANLVAGGVAIVTALALGARRLRIVGGPASRGIVLRGLLIILGSFLTAAAVERAAARSGIRFDWTFEQRFELSPATRRALDEISESLTATLFFDSYDPRVRRTRLLLQTLALHGDLEIRERQIEQSPQEEEQFGVGTSNTVVLQIGQRFETVERPTEGAIFEALYRLRSLEGGVVTLLRGEGQGDPERDGDLGYSGLAAALDTEGYELQSIATAAMVEVPENTDVLLVLAPRRNLRDVALDAIRRYLEGGGRPVALLEPGVDSGIDFSSNKFGYYLTSLDGTFYSDSSLNPGGLEYMYAYHGNGDQIQILPFSPGIFGPGEYILAFEDHLIGGADPNDKTGMVLLVESSHPHDPPGSSSGGGGELVPEPTMLILVALGLVGIGLFRRRPNSA